MADFIGVTSPDHAQAHLELGELIFRDQDNPRETHPYFQEVLTQGRQKRLPKKFARDWVGGALERLQRIQKETGLPVLPRPAPVLNRKNPAIVRVELVERDMDDVVD